MTKHFNILPPSYRTWWDYYKQVAKSNPTVLLGGRILTKTPEGDTYEVSVETLKAYALDEMAPLLLNKELFKELVVAKDSINHFIRVDTTNINNLLNQLL